ncbi:MAG: arsenosugar biosynthesis radical SAM protein ArsS [Deltaproteobacteria bacterium]|nr:arsenosugar biosynthesis radical SAM protein ArsS [Deltaproteobacteria bacterium]
MDDTRSDIGAQGASNPFDASLLGSRLFPLMSSGVTVLQVNMGRLCNQSCRHCHVEAGPGRVEVMGRVTLEACVNILKERRYPIVDITGGAPEMNPNYRWFVQECLRLGCHVKTRTNLTILLEEGYKDLPAFFAGSRVEVIASLPYYLPDETDRQRGEGVFEASIEALKILNSFGYGVEGGLALNLVFNPCGAFLPPSQKSITEDFRKELKKRYGISFTGLFTITNMPIGRFLKFLKDSGNLKRYMERLKSSYNPVAASNVMCRQTLSVGWDGSLFDCDFNQMLGLRCDHGAPDHIEDFKGAELEARRIVTGLHCYGCTAGAGSSCTGAVA